MQICLNHQISRERNFLVKNPPAMQETWIWSLVWEGPLEKGKSTHSSILALENSIDYEAHGSQRVGHDWVTFNNIINILVAMSNTRDCWGLEQVAPKICQCGILGFYIFGCTRSYFRHAGSSLWHVGSLTVARGI